MKKLLDTLHELNIRLEVRNGRLHVNAPAGVLTAELQQAISQQKNVLLEMLQSVRVEPAQDEIPQIVPDQEKRHEPFPLNDVQHAYWIGRSPEIELGSVSTHVYFEFECGSLEPGKLTASFRKVVQLHDMLRAVVDMNGQQRVLKTVPPYEITVTELRGTNQDHREKELLRIRSEMSHEIFACDLWPLFNIRLVQISDRHSRLCVSLDFLMVDAWSMMLIFRQWSQYYQDPAYEVPVPTLTFRDYVLAEGKRKEHATYQRSKQYWWDRLDHLPPAPQLPIAGNVNRNSKHEFRRRRLRLPADQWQLVKTRARRSGITPTSVLLAAFSEVLNLWSKSPHYCLNLTLFNRVPLHPEVMAIVGDFTNLLALEIDAREPASFSQLCARIQAQFLRDYDHRQVNLLEVLRELVKRHVWQQAKLPVVFTSTLMLDGKRSDDAGVLESFGPLGYGITQTPQVWLDYQIFEVNGDLIVNWDAFENVFLPGVLDDMFESHRELLHLLVADPDAWQRQGLAAMPRVQQQRRELVDHTGAEIVDRRLHELFIKKAMECPERVAIISGHVTMRYGELLAHSNIIAEQIIRSGVRPQELVAVVMQKGWEQVVAVMGVLIAGAAYLPIEPNWPTLRRNHILEHAEVRIALTQPTLNRQLEWPAQVARIDVAAREATDSLKTAPPIRQSSEDLAYVIFTSGSTGTPKGVMISHAGAVNTIAHVNRMFDVRTEDRVLAVSDLTFDLSVYDLFGILATGGAIVIPDAELSRDPSHWEDLIRRHHVTVWNSAPPLMGMLVDGWESAAASQLTSLRLVLLSGDWIPVPLPGRIQRLSPDARVISLGGATEGSIWSIYYPIQEVSSMWDSVPYGKALPNQHVYVLNKALQPCPELVVGDIFLGGLGVAMGYLKDPEKTARQFLIDSRTGERLYYTGDLGRMGRDGNIEFLGRADSQVKLRGHRVELGEITACLQSHPEVRAAAVRVLKQDNKTVLTGYVMADKTGALFEPAELSPEQLQEVSRRIEAATNSYISNADGEGLQFFWRFWKDVEDASIGAMLQTLETLGLVNGSNAANQLDHLIVSGRVLPQYRRMVTNWLNALVDWGRLVFRDGSYTPSEIEIPGAGQVEWQLLALEQSFIQDDLKGFAEHVVSCLRNHLALLSGEMSALSLLFPQGSWRVAESLYEKNAVVRHHNGLLATLANTLVGLGDNDKTLRVLEIGAGTGGMSVAVLPLLPAAQTEYTYTDVSTYFFSAAREKFHAYPFIQYAVYDLNKDPRSQGHQPQSYDLIIAANVLHNALDMNSVLSSVRELLRPGGYLLLLEGTLSTPWMWATVAFLEDSRVASDRWVLGVDEWVQTLAKAGFESVQVFPAAGQDRLSELLTAMPQHVIAARAPAHVTRFRREELAAFLRERLPDYMVPQRFVPLDTLPLTSNGKVNLDALPTEFELPKTEARRIVVPKSETEEWILKVWKDVLGIEQLTVTDNFFEVGGDSLLITEVMRKLNRSRSSPLTIAELLSHPTVRSLADYLSPEPATTSGHAVAAPPESPQTQTPTGDIAVIGMAGRFPGADNVEQFWDNVAAGKCAVSFLTDEELLDAGVAPEELANPSYVKAGFFLKNIDLFDAGFFGFTPRDAEIMDPQQRFLMECAVEALDNAGYPCEKHARKIGVFVGKGASFYFLEHLLPRHELVQQLGMMPIVNANEKDYAATLISYKLNLTGPSVNVNTACSTSLVAVHLACESLRRQECEVALAGGASIVTLRRAGYLYREGHIMSPDGVCRAFSDDAKGTVFGSGVGLVVLKPLDSALRDGDAIHAVIKGSAINNDGALKVNFNAPSLQGQAEVIATAQARASVDPNTIQLVEAHGTGTELGDPVEFDALRRVFGSPKPDGTHCSLGSVKSNIGHLDTAAGIAGMIKAVQALKHKLIPPTLHVSVPSRKVDFADSPFELTSVSKDWEAGAVPRRAGVSSFGVGGTNAHVVLEEAPVVKKRPSSPGPQILPVSAKSQESLKGMMLALSDEFGRCPELSLQDVAFTLQVGRSEHPYRSYLVCDLLSEARAEFANPERVATEHKGQGLTPAMVFLFPGQGSLRKGATRELYENDARFRSAFEECADIVQQYTGERLRDWLYAAQQDQQIEQTATMHPLLFSIEYALARLWESLGVRPAALLGHSLGEYVAACLAGVFSLAEALSLMVVRGRLLQSLPPGHMLAVNCAEAQLSRYLEESACALAAVNGPSQCVASGPCDEIIKLQTRLRAEGISNSLLRTSCAFHSAMVEPVLETFESCVAQVERRPPSIPFISNVTGRWITDAEATSPAYWTRHLRQTVRFGEGLKQALGLTNRVFLEVGPGRILTTLVKQTDYSTAAIPSLCCENDSQSEQRSFLQAVGQLWLQGVEIDWTLLHHPGESRRVPLAGYIFDRKRYWIERPARLLDSSSGASKIEEMPATGCVGADPPVSPESGDGCEVTSGAGPQNEIDEIASRLVKIWKSYLGIPNIGLLDSFFTLGGDSLLAVRVHSQIRQEFNVELPLTGMFELATVRHISLYIAISRNPELIDTFSEQDLDEVLAVMESWPAGTRPELSKHATAGEGEKHI